MHILCPTISFLCRSVSDTPQTNGASRKLAINSSSQARASHTKTPHPVRKTPTLHNLPSDYMGLPCFITADSKTFPTPLLTRRSVRLCRDVSTQFPDRQERVHRQNQRLLGVLVKALISTDQRLAKCRQDNLILRGIIEQSTLRIDSSVNSIGSLKAKLEDKRRMRPLWFHCTWYVWILSVLSYSCKLPFLVRTRRFHGEWPNRMAYYSPVDIVFCTRARRSSNLHKSEQFSSLLCYGAARRATLFGTAKRESDLGQIAAKMR